MDISMYAIKYMLFYFLFLQSSSGILHQWKILQGEITSLLYQEPEIQYVLSICLLQFQLICATCPSF